MGVNNWILQDTTRNGMRCRCNHPWHFSSKDLFTRQGDENPSSSPRSKGKGLGPSTWKSPSKDELLTRKSGYLGRYWNIKESRGH